MIRDTVSEENPGRAAVRGFWVALTAITLFSLFVNFWHLGASSIHTTDEALTGLTSRDMVTSGNWWTPTIGGHLRFTKPPLYFWLTALAFQSFGISLFWLRFWAASAGTGAVVLTGLLGRKIYGARAGAISAAALATSTEFVHEHGARVGCMDTLVVFFILAGFLLALRGRKQPASAASAGLVLGLANLTKNFLGFLPLGILGLTRLVNGRRIGVGRKHLTVATLLFILVSGIWPASMSMLHPGRFWKVFAGQESIGRFRPESYQNVGGLEEVHSGPARASYFAKSFLKGIYPWSLLSPILLFWTIRRVPRWRRDERLLPPIWAVVLVVGLVSMANARTWYSLMGFPAFALLTGAFLAEILSEPGKSRGLAAASFALLSAAVFFPPNSAYDPFFADGMPQARLLVAVTPRRVALFLVLIAVAIWLARQSTRIAVLLLPLVLAIPAAALTALPLRFAEEMSSVERIARKVVASGPAFGNLVTYWNAPELDPVRSFPWYWAPARWYLERLDGVTIRRPVPGTAEALFRLPRPILVLTTPESLPAERKAEIVTVRGRMESHGSQLVLLEIGGPAS